MGKLASVEAVCEVNSDGLYCLLTNGRHIQPLYKEGDLFVCFAEGLEYPDDFREYILKLFPDAMLDKAPSIGYHVIEDFLDGYRNVIRFSGQYRVGTELGDLLGVRKV